MFGKSSKISFFDAQKLPKHPRNDPEQLWKKMFSTIFVEFRPKISKNNDISRYVDVVLDILKCFLDVLTFFLVIFVYVR